LESGYGSFLSGAAYAVSPMMLFRKAQHAAIMLPSLIASATGSWEYSLK
jgi:hypothetical protein